MKRIFTTIAILIIATVASYAQVTVTFHLDMRGTNFNSSTTDLYISGDAAGIDWATPGSNPSLQLTDTTKINDSIYSVVLPSVDSGYYYMDYYKTEKGATEWGPEWPTPLGHDRMLYIDGKHNVVVNDKWGEVLTVTLNVDMNQVTTFDSTTQDVYIAGNIYPMSWETAGTNPKFKLKDTNHDGIYSIAFDSISGADFFYKYYLVSASDTIPEWTDSQQGWRVLHVSAQNTHINDTFGLVTTGINNIQFKNIRIYPNPSSGRFTLYTDRDYKVKVMNMLGQTILSKQVFKGNNVFNLTNNPTGIYFVRIQSGTHAKTFKVIVR